MVSGRVGVTYRSSSARPSGKGLPPPPPPPSAPAPSQPLPPPPSFRDKESYNELFKPLPKPEPIPTLGGTFQIESKSWRQLQEEREALMTKEIQKTKDEAVSLWDRAKQEDNKRVAMIMSEKQRVEEEQRKREEIMRKSHEEVLAKGRARKLEIARQEELLQGRSRNLRAKTEGNHPSDPSGGRGGGIQVYHYKDPEVEEIVRSTNKEEIRRRMSHGELLKDFQNGTQPLQSPSAESLKDRFFNAQVMLRSQSSSSNTSR